MEQLIDSIPQKRQDYLQWIRVQQGSIMKLVAVEEVCYFQAGDGYTTVVTREDELLISKPIKDLDDDLDPNRFWRIHRGTISNVSQIDKVSLSMPAGAPSR